MLTFYHKIKKIFQKISPALIFRNKASLPVGQHNFAATTAHQLQHRCDNSKCARCEVKENAWKVPRCKTGFCSWRIAPPRLEVVPDMSRVNIRARCSRPLNWREILRAGRGMRRERERRGIYPWHETAVQNRKYLLALTYISRDDGAAVG